MYYKDQWNLLNVFRLLFSGMVVVTLNKFWFTPLFHLLYLKKILLMTFLVKYYKNIQGGQSKDCGQKKNVMFFTKALEII